MPRKPNEKYDEAYRMFLEGAKLVDIATELGVPEGTVRRWKSTHKWDSERSDKKKANARKRKRGGQPGNKNTKKHGFFSKWLPEETKEILGVMPSNPLDLMWVNIQLQMAAIIRAQGISYVTGKDDMTKEVIADGAETTAYDIQQAWDKQANFMAAQSRAMKTLESMIKSYDDLLHKNWDMATDEQKARIELVKAQTKKMEASEETAGQEDFRSAIISAAERRIKEKKDDGTSRSD